MALITAEQKHIHARSYPSAPESITSARRFVRTLCGGWRLSDHLVSAAELVTSELITNAYEAAHERDDVFELRVRYSDGQVRIQVWDRSEEKPQEGSPTLDATSGRGLLIVSEFARRWGVTAGEDVRGGKWVWAVL
jgi:anti-sigma regulatory factor (Ser/Thr protein kinase)